ncbi:MAG: glycosyl hydrolase 108 family protein, partial [Plesiomonas shigelloides]
MVSLRKKKLSDIGFEDILIHSVNVEAGHVNDPDDRGGETNHGITYATAQEWKADLVAKFNWDGTMRNLTREMAMYIYEYGWWRRLRCPELLEIHPLIAQRVFDFGINAGRARAGRAIQIILNVSNRCELDYADISEDGAIGT